MARLLMLPILLIAFGCEQRSPRKLADPDAELGRKLRSGSVTTRRDAAFTLCRLAMGDGLPDGRGLPATEKPALRDALQDGDTFNRLFAAHALAEMGEADEAVLAVYEVEMSNADTWARVQACCGVRKNAGLLAASLQMLTAALDDDDSAVVWEAAQSLAKCDSIGRRDTLDKLLKVARKSKNTPALQEAAVRALGKADATHATAVLEQLRSVECFHDENFDVRPVKQEAMAALTKTTRTGATK